MSLEPFGTAEAHDSPTVRQLSVFIENRVGQLLQLTRLLEETDIHILGISVVNSLDCAVIRMIVDDPDEAHRRFSDSGFAVSETELLVVSLPPGKRALLGTWTALMAGEVNVNYTYPLLVRPQGRPAIALQADNPDMAANVLRSKKYDVLGQSDLLSHYD
ncbi:MAG TPA: acetolactate synthase [Phycisphaerae bacterium]|nr:acetolactate synthase [Phycisphaerae bacterium]